MESLQTGAYSQGLGGGAHQDQNAEKNEEILRKNKGKGWKMRKFLGNTPTCLTGSETLNGCGPVHNAFVRLCMNRVCSTCCIDNYKPIANLELFCLPFIYKSMGTRKVKIISNKSTICHLNSSPDWNLPKKKTKTKTKTKTKKTLFRYHLHSNLEKNPSCHILVINSELHCIQLKGMFINTLVGGWAK